jgi:hypothetical protein
MKWSIVLPTRLWMTLKLVRSPTLLATLAAGLAISGCIAYLCHRFGITDSATLSITATLLASSVAADSRIACRTYRPLEIAGVRGSTYFVWQLLAAIVPFCMISIAPLIWLYLQQENLEVAPILNITMGILCGFCASLLTAPGPRNISGQFSSILLCMAFVFISERFIATYAAPIFSYSAATVLLVLLSLIIEYRRNPYYWRKDHA